jgi:outer membrane receptor protein involved in Fe transport
VTARLRQEDARRRSVWWQPWLLPRQGISVRTAARRCRGRPGFSGCHRPKWRAGERDDRRFQQRRTQFRGARSVIAPAEAIRLRLIADYSRFNSNCCTQVYFGVGTSLKPAARQYPALAAGVGYAPPSLNPYDRLTDIDAGLKVATNEGGISAIADWNVGPGTITSVSAWRWWNWDAANDRDYTSLSIQTLQHIPSRQDQYSQELRIASNGTHLIDYVAGLYWFSQTVKGEPITQYGPLATYWLLGPTPTYPSNLLNGYLTDGHTRFHSDSYAAFGEAVWHATSKLAVTAGARYTVENKDGRYDSTVSGGLATTSTTLNNAKLSILRPQSYAATVNDGAASGRVNLSYAFNEQVMPYITYTRGSKSGGINMSGLPLNAANLPALATAVVKPEKNTTTELGVKTRLFERHLLLNVDVYDTTVRDFQTNVVDTGPGALRGYLANIDKVRVRGLEADATFHLASHLTGYVSSAITDTKYVSYKNGPCPLEFIGSATTVCDLSGKPLSATPHTVVSAGGEYVMPTHVGALAGEAFGPRRCDYANRYIRRSVGLEIHRYPRLHPRKRQLRVSERGTMGGLCLGKESAQQKLHAEPDGAGGQLRSDCGNTERSADRRRHVARIVLGVPQGRVRRSQKPYPRDSIRATMPSSNRIRCMSLLGPKLYVHSSI